MVGNQVYQYVGHAPTTNSWCDCVHYLSTHKPSWKSALITNQVHLPEVVGSSLTRTLFLKCWVNKCMCMRIHFYLSLQEMIMGYCIATNFCGATNFVNFQQLGKIFQQKCFWHVNTMLTFWLEECQWKTSWLAGAKLPNLQETLSWDILLK